MPDPDSVLCDVYAASAGKWYRYEGGDRWVEVLLSEKEERPKGVTGHDVADVIVDEGYEGDESSSDPDTRDCDKAGEVGHYWCGPCRHDPSRNLTECGRCTKEVHEILANARTTEGVERELKARLDPAPRSLTAAKLAMDCITSSYIGFDEAPSATESPAYTSLAAWVEANRHRPEACEKFRRQAKLFLDTYEAMDDLVIELSEAKRIETINWGQIVSALYSTAHWAEKHLPRPCGECPVCRRAAGKCEHGWSSPRMCPTCRGSQL